MAAFLLLCLWQQALGRLGDSFEKKLASAAVAPDSGTSSTVSCLQLIIVRATITTVGVATAFPTTTSVTERITATTERTKTIAVSLDSADEK